MEKVTVTYEQVYLFQQNAEMYLSAYKDSRNSFLHALSRVLKGIKGIIDDYNDELLAIRLKYTTVDKEGKNSISPEKQVLISKETRKFLAQEVEAPRYLATYIPEDLGHLEWSVLYPFVLADEFPPQSKEEPQNPS